MQSLNANLMRSLRRADIAPIVLVQILAATDETWKFCSGAKRVFDHTPSVDSVPSFASKLDPLLRSVSVGNVDVTFSDDGAHRRLMTLRFLRNKTLTIKLGTSGLVEDDYETRFVGTIRDVIPSSDRGTIVVRCVNRIGQANEKKLSPDWICLHPIEIGKDIIDRVGLDDSDSSLDYTAYSHNHFVVSRAVYSGGTISRHPGATEATSRSPAGELLGQLGFLLGGAFVPNELGVVRWVEFDSSAAVSRTLTRDDILSFDQNSASEELFNRAVLSFGKDPDRPIKVQSDRWVDISGDQSTGQTTQTVTFDDTTAQTLAGAIDQPFISGVIEEPFETDWLESLAQVSGGDGGGGILSTAYPLTEFSTHFRVAQAYTGFCGSRMDPDLTFSDSVEITDPLDDDHLGFIRVGDEVISVDRSAPIGGVGDGDKPSRLIANGRYFPLEIEYRILSRALFGTSMPPSGAYEFGSPCRDITIAVRRLQQLVGRVANGSPEIAFALPLRHLELQLADLIDLTDDVFIEYGRDGLTPGSKYEIVEKNEDVFASPPKISIVAVKVRDASPPETTPVWTINVDAPVPKEVVDHGNDDNVDFGNNYFEGGGFSHAGTLAGTFEAADVKSHHRRSKRPTDHVYTYPASKDTYVSHDRWTGGVVLRSVALSATEPVVWPNESKAWKVTTDGSAITAAVSRRKLYPFEWGMLDPDTVPAGDPTDITIDDNSANAFRVRESSRNYLHVSTTDGAETMTYGSDTTEPEHGFYGNVSPGEDNSYDLGSDDLRFRKIRGVNIQTGDLNLKSSDGRRHWTIVEGEHELYAVNRMTNEAFALGGRRIDMSEVPPFADEEHES